MSRHTTLAHAHTGTHVLTNIDVCATQCTGPARAHTLPTEAQRSPTTCPPLESTHGLWISSGKESVPSHTGPWSREARVPRQEDTSRPGTVRPWSPGMLAVPWAGPLQPWLTLSPTRHASLPGPTGDLAIGPRGEASGHGWLLQAEGGAQLTALGSRHSGTWSMAPHRSATLPAQYLGCRVDWCPHPQEKGRAPLQWASAESWEVPGLGEGPQS